MVNFAETVLYTTPSKPVEENIIPYTYEEVVMCVHTYGECYYNINKELSLFGEANGDDKPGAIKRALDWLKKMIMQFWNWLKRKFGFTNIKSNVDTKTAEDIRMAVNEHNKKNTKAVDDAKMKVYRDKMEPLVDRFFEHDHGGEKLSNEDMYGLVLQCVHIVSDAINDSSLHSKGYEYVSKALLPNDVYKLTAWYPSVFNNSNIGGIYGYIMKLISENKDIEDIRKTFFDSLRYCKATDGTFGFEFVQPANFMGELDNFTEFTSTCDTNKIIHVILDNAFKNTPIDTSALNCILSASFSNSINATTVNKIKEVPNTISNNDQVKVATELVNALAKLAEIENANRTFAFMYAVVYYLLELMKVVDIEIFMIHSDDSNS